MSERVYLNTSDPTVRQIVSVAFPSYNGRRVSAILTDSITFHGTMWDEGSRRQYVGVNLATMQKVAIPTEQFGARSDDHHTPVEIPEGVVFVVYNQWGQRDSIEIHARPDSVSPMLPKPVELTDDEKTVLIATRSLKSSYDGKKDYRFSEARDRRGITRERWDVAKASLIGKKFLTKAGAITTEGRNVAGTDQL